MKGYVPTPDALVDKMVEHLFSGMLPNPTDFLLEPGCGDGQFIDGVLRWCRSRQIQPPRILGVEINPALASKARERFKNEAAVEIVEADYLAARMPVKFRFVVGNPPYVSLENITEDERETYRGSFNAARGRFDLYMLFFERAIVDLADDGRLVFVTPEKFVYVESAGSLRNLLATFQIESIELIPEDTFTDRTTYPAVTTLRKRSAKDKTAASLRDGERRQVDLPGGGITWLPLLMGHDVSREGMVPLISYCRRISAGVATGADGIFIRPIKSLSAGLRQFAYPALAGRDLSLNGDALPAPNKALLVPYDEDGRLIEEDKLGALGLFLREANIRQRLEMRTCAERKPWYAFHDNCPMPDIMQPKILFKDIGERPKFWIDRSGAVLPLHTVYYIVPSAGVEIDLLCDWLNGTEALLWFKHHCHRAANGFIRLQSRVIKNLPVPAKLTHKNIQRVA